MNKFKLVVVVAVLLLVGVLGISGQNEIGAMVPASADSEMSVKAAVLHSLVSDGDIINKQDVTFKGVYRVFEIGGESAKRMLKDFDNQHVLVFEDERVILILKDKEA